MLVVWSHSFALYRGSEETEPLSKLTGGVINSGNLGVYVFFIVSGFLITQSFDRSKSASRFLGRRIARIYPGYLIAVLICGFVIIPAYTTSFVYSPKLVAKLIGLNLLLQGFFPESGAFARNPVGAVNGSLWSISYEFWCYLGVLALGISKATGRRGRKYTLALFVLIVCVRIWLDVSGKKPGGGIIGQIIGWPYLWFKLLPCFLAGMLAYEYRDFFVRSGWLALLGVTLFLLATNLPVVLPWKLALSGFLFPPAVAYLVLYAAFAPRLIDAAKYGDFSYGTYLYAFPIQQMLRATFGVGIPFWLYIPLSIVLALSAGIVSWYGVERWFHRSNSKARQRSSSNDRITAS